MDLVTLKSFDNAIDAHLLRIELENEGIECFIYDEHLVTMNPLFSNAVGGIKVKVFRKDLDLANTILFPLPEDTTLTISCSACGSQNIQVNYRSMKGFSGTLSAITSLFFGTYPIYYKTVHKCKDCGNEFKDS